MKTIHLLPALFTLIALVSCNSTQKEGSNDQIIRLPTSFERGEFSLSEIASDILFIPLKTDIPIPPIRKIEFFDSTIVLVDQSFAKLFRFRFDGSFVDILDKQGRGPGEYMAINDFHVDKSGTIYINCGTNKRILVYNNDLTYNTTIPHPKDLTRGNVRWLDSIMVFFPNEIGELSKYDWVTTNYKGEILDFKLDPYSGRIRSYSSSNSFLAYEKNAVIYRYRNWSDTIFGISNNGVRANYVYERKFADGLRTSSLDEILLEAMSVDEITEATQRTGKRNIYAIYDLGKKLIITYQGEKNESVLFDPIKNNSKIILDDNKGLARIPNDWIGSGHIDIRNIVKIGTDRYIVDYIDAMKIKSIVQSDSFLKGESTWPEKKNEFQMLGDNLNENDNPALVLIKLK